MKVILLYFKVVIDLNTSQASTSQAAEASIRGTALKAWIKTRQCYYQFCQDHASNCVQDSDTSKQLIKILIIYFNEGKMILCGV